MKKLIALLLALAMTACLFACGETEQNPPATTTAPTEAPTEPSEPEADGVMTYAEYVAAELDTQCTVEFFVQATQGWWFDSSANHGKITIYGQSPEGGYFAYEVNCDEETGKKLVAGTKVRVTGDKKEWDGEVELMNATLEIVEAETWIAEPLDVTAKMASEDLIDDMNKKVAIKGATIVAANADGATFLYKWNGAGSEGDDLYFNVQIDGKTYTLVVESYLCGLGSETYEAVRGLKVGDVIDIEGFLYWYNGAQPHVYKVTVK